MINLLLKTTMVLALAFSGWFFYQWWSGTEGVVAIDAETDPPSQVKEGDLSAGDYVADLVIPGTGKKYLTYWGTEDESLDQGVGMHVSQWTTAPDQGGHTVLSGHRDTVFTEMGDLEIGDTMTVTYSGVEYTYEIEDIWITDAEDRTVIVEKEEPTLTLTTCYPFDFIGPAPDRYIMQGSLVETSE
ncbi:class D sortase [Salipaludibacillus aurantiacus]|uniref:Sortase A n=1 Tax=Salipaludibacillus aurantiacus TaxID=1601833 RepID=A0A1H9QBX0_9BACI|nr:class D sortase [Salipaludibacillus aurantiacus]SER57908.1 sortase A [Salipaludibacillus aurantiacus]